VTSFPVAEEYLQWLEKAVAVLLIVMLRENLFGAQIHMLGFFLSSCLPVYSGQIKHDIGSLDMVQSKFALSYFQSLIEERLRFLKFSWRRYTLRGTSTYPPRRGSFPRWNQEFARPCA